MTKKGLIPLCLLVLAALATPTYSGEEVILSLSTPQNLDYLGYNFLDMDGNFLIVSRGYPADELIIFRRSGSGWTEDHRIATGWNSTECPFPGSCWPVNQLGRAVVRGSTIVLSGSYGSDEVLVYENDATGWHLSQTIADPSSDTYSSFGANYADLDLDGNLLAVAAPGVDGSCTNQGVIYLYERSAPGSPFSLRQELWDEGYCDPIITFPRSCASGCMGYEITMSGDTLVEGHGQVWIDSGSSGFVLDHQVVPEYASADGTYGYETQAPVLDGDTLVYGSPRYAVIPPTCGRRGCSDPGFVPGAAFIYTRSGPGSPFSHNQDIIPSDPASADKRFGQSVALDGNRLLITQQGQWLPAGGQGDPASYVYTRTLLTDPFVLEEIFTPCELPTTNGYHHYGLNVALDGADFVVSAHALTVSGQWGGGIYIQGDCQGSENLPPVAHAGGDRTESATCESAGVTTPVLLDGSLSYDPDGDPLTFLWTGAAFGSAAGETTLVNLPLGANAVNLTVDDGNGGQASDGATVTLVDTTSPVVGAPSALTAICSSLDTAGLGQAGASDPDLVAWLDGASASDACDADVLAGADGGDFFGIGSTTVTWTASDDAGNTGSDTSTIQVVYEFGGFEPPLLPDGSASIRQGKQGRTIPVKFSLGCGGTPVDSATATLGVYLVLDAATGSVDTTDLTEDSGQSADNGNLFRYDPAGQHYIYNLSTKGMAADATYRIVVTLDDGTQHTIDFSLR